MSLYRKCTGFLFSMQQKPSFPTLIDRKMKEGTKDGILCCCNSCSHARIKHFVCKRMQFQFCGVRKKRQCDFSRCLFSFWGYILPDGRVILLPLATVILKHTVSVIFYSHQLTNGQQHYAKHNTTAKQYHSP